MPSPTALPIELDVDDVMIGVDPHKSSWTAVVVDPRQRRLATIRVEVGRPGYRRLRRFAASFPDARWAIEGARGLGAPLTAWFRADGVEVLDVPAKLACKVRMLSTGHGRKSDEGDLWSVGVAALTTSRLTAAAIDEAAAVLRALTEHRDDLVRTRTQTANRLHSLLTQLVPAGHARGLTATDAATALRTVRPRTPVGSDLGVTGGVAGLDDHELRGWPRLGEFPRRLGRRLHVAAPFDEHARDRL